MLVVLPPVRSQGLSAGLSHDAWRLPEAATTIPGTAVSSISFRSFHLGELSSYPQTSPPCISLEVPKKLFAGIFPNRALTTSLKITLLLSGMHFVKFSTYARMRFDLWSCSLDGLAHYSSRTHTGIDCTHIL